MTFDEQIAARTMYAECRGEPEAGQRGVAHVIVNRLKSGRWGTKFAGVCLAPKQFSCWNDNDPTRLGLVTVPEDHPKLALFAKFLKEAESEPDPTQGALHYFNPNTVAEPKWAKDKPFTQIGNHRFVRGVK